jgi:hypothetical protein
VNCVGFAFGATGMLGTESKLTPVKQTVDLMQHSSVGEVAATASTLYVDMYRNFPRLGT